MNTSTRWLSTALLVCVAGTASAQRSTGLEIGVDAALTHTSRDVPDGSSTTFAFPAQAVRLGFALTPTVWLEPTLGIETVSEHGTFNTFTFDVGLPISLSGPVDRRITQYFVRPMVGFRHFGNPDVSGTQTAFGAGIGMRVPLVDRLASRFEARYVRGLRSDGTFPASDEFSLLAGLSFFTR
ncbi:MAG: outer membrane beta-barrel protein [Gemmatimonadaceae bacterium]